MINASIQLSGKLQEFANNYSPSCGLGSGEYRIEFTNNGGTITARFRVSANIDTFL